MLRRPIIKHFCDNGVWNDQPHTMEWQCEASDFQLIQLFVTEWSRCQGIRHVLTRRSDLSIPFADQGLDILEKIHFGIGFTHVVVDTDIHCTLSVFITGT